MGTHMKTTIDIADPLMSEARKIAAREGVTVRALVESGLRHVIAEKKRSGKAFRLRRGSFKGNGLQPGMDGLSWERIRELAYDGRGA